MTSTPSERARAAVGHPTVVVAVGGVPAGDPGLSHALRSLVIEPVLEEFPVKIAPVPAAPDVRTLDGVRRRIAKARLVIADIGAASPEVLLLLARRGPQAGRTVLLAPAAAGAARADDIVRHPATAEGVKKEEAALRSALTSTLLGDRDGAARQAEKLRLDFLAGRKSREGALRRIEAGTIPVRDPGDVVLNALARAYNALGCWEDVVRVVEFTTTVADGAADVRAMPHSVVWPYVVALNRIGCGVAAQTIIEERLDQAGDEKAELWAALGRIHKDRWAVGGPESKQELGRAITAYINGFSGGNYYPGINALTLMVAQGAEAERVQSQAALVRQSLERGPNADEHPWWYAAARLQVEVIAGAGAGDFEAANRELDALLAQPSEEWMRASTADDLKRVAEHRNRLPSNRTLRSQLEDSEEVRSILEIRQAVLDRARRSRRGLPAHCLLEITRRGGDRWVNFTNTVPSPLFCRAKRDKGGLGKSVLFGNPLNALLEEGADVSVRERKMRVIAAQLVKEFRLDETSISTEIGRGDEERYLVLQLDEFTAIEPWELLAQEEGRYLSLETGFARRLWLESGMALPRSAKTRRRALVIGDPTGDLDGARAEAKQVAEQLASSGAFPEGVVPLIGSDATQDRVAEALDLGGIDLLHYAGHAVQDGMLLADGSLLEPDALTALVTSPSMVIANACSSGGVLPKASTGTYQASFVTALVAAGVGVYLGCAWPVGDAQAKCFSERFYGELLKGRPVGGAVREGRAAIREDSKDDFDPNWPAYVLYGNPWFRLIEAPEPASNGEE